MAISGIYILDVKGKVLIQKSYRGDVDASVIDKFIQVVQDREEDSNLTPIVEADNCTLCYVKHNGLFLVAATKRNAPVTLVFQLLHKLILIFKDYFKDLEEESVRDNFVIIYELLDEVCDFGYPQTTDTKILQEFITQESSRLEIQPRPPVAVTNAVSWRSEGIRYRKNEVFLDVIESINLLAAANGTVLRSEIVGSVKMRTFLSGMPELRWALMIKFYLSRRAGLGQRTEPLNLKMSSFISV